MCGCEGGTCEGEGVDVMCEGMHMWRCACVHVRCEDECTCGGVSGIGASYIHLLVTHVFNACLNFLAAVTLVMKER